MSATFWGAAGIPAPTIITGSGDITVTKNNTVVICTDTSFITLPPASPGFMVCVRNSPGLKQQITINGREGQYFESPKSAGGWAIVGSSLVSTSTTQSNICLQGYDDTHYLITNQWGLWNYLLSLVPRFTWLGTAVSKVVKFLKKPEKDDTVPSPEPIASSNEELEVSDNQQEIIAS